MTDKPTGGPAYPQATQTFQESRTEGGYVLKEQSGGMTLRDYFAGQALAGYLSYGQKWDNGANGAAVAVYYMADAMIAARDSQ